MQRLSTRHMDKMACKQSHKISGYEHSKKWFKEHIK